MSSSKKKQLRKEQYMTERQTTAAQEAKKLKRYTVTFWVVIALVLSIFIGAVSWNPVKNVLYKNTDAITVGDHTLSAVELNYFYVDAVNNYVNQWSDYISYIMDTSKPLNEQVSNSETGATWADDFMTTTTTNIKKIYSLYDAATAKGFTLTEDEQKSIDSTISLLDIYASLYGYSNANAYLRAYYGNGATTKSYRNYLEVSTLANSYLSAYTEELEYDADDLKAYDAKAPYKYNTFTYASYYLGYAKFQEGEKDEKGNFVYDNDDAKNAAIAAAREAAKAAAEELAAGNYADLDAFDEAIKALDMKINSTETSTAASTKSEDVLYSKVNSLFSDWLIGKVSEEGKDDEYVTRTEGELTVIPYSSGSGENEVIYGYYVVRFGSVNENNFALKNVRHILVAYEGGTTDSDGNKTYSDEEKATAKAKAELLLTQWEAGTKTEDSFAELANKESADTGSNTNGGLYEDVYPGQMIENFDAWVYDEARKSGDYGIVEGTSGYHIIYFSGLSLTSYRNYMVENALRSEDVSNYQNDLVEAISLEILTTKYAPMDMVISHSH